MTLTTGNSNYHSSKDTSQNHGCTNISIGCTFSTHIINHLLAFEAIILTGF